MTQYRTRHTLPDQFKCEAFDDVFSTIASPYPSVLQTHLRKIGNASGISTDVEMSQYLDAVLEEAIAAYEATNGAVPSSLTAALKWRYSSAYQKAVRRNDASIKDVAEALNRCDPAYIWRRAQTIVLEDISLGDPWVCALVLHACRFARLRARFGQDRLAGFIGSLMGSSIKDRLSCDGFCLAFLDPRMASDRAQVIKLTMSERAQLFRSDATPFPLRVAAGIALAGPRYGGSILPCLDGSPGHLGEVVEELAPYLIQWISRQYSRSARDGMFVTLPLIWRQLISEGLVEVAMPKPCERTLIKPLVNKLPSRWLIARMDYVCDSGDRPFYEGHFVPCAAVILTVLAGSTRRIFEQIHGRVFAPNQLDNFDVAQNRICAFRTLIKRVDGYGLVRCRETRRQVRLRYAHHARIFFS